jgi:hypothetical protein
MAPDSWTAKTMKILTKTVAILLTLSFLAGKVSSIQQAGNARIQTAKPQADSIATQLESTQHANFLQPGDGFERATPEPQPVGIANTPEFDIKVIARWDVVPYQTLDGDFDIGVVAFHIHGIDRVEFSANGGPWLPTRQMRLNPRTSVKEYYVTVRASDFDDGPIEIRAIVWPIVGRPRVLAGPQTGTMGANYGEHSLFLCTNANGTLQENSVYVAVDGDDVQGDGTQTNPFASIMRAANHLQTLNATEDADGGTIFLMGGEHQLGSYRFDLMTKTVDRWLTITRHPRFARSDVRIVGSASGDGIRTKLVRIKDITVTGSLNSNGPLEDYIWFCDVDFEGPGKHVNTVWGSGWSGAFATDASIRSMRDGWVDMNLVRNARVDRIGSDAFTNSALVLNSIATDIDHRGTSFHPDVYQHNGPAKNIIVYGLTAIDNIQGQGVFAGDQIPVTDIAYVDVQVAVQGLGHVFQFGGPTHHFLIKDSRFTGSTAWMNNFNASNVVFDNTWFTAPPRPRPGVSFR